MIHHPYLLALAAAICLCAAGIIASLVIAFTEKKKQDHDHADYDAI